MKVSSLTGSKVLLTFCNFILLACGSMLITGGLLILFDSNRVLISRLLATGPMSNLSHPLLFYVALGLVTLGLILAAAGVLGCWAACVYNYCILSLYFFLVMVVLVCECAVYTVTWLWPHCVGLGPESTNLAKALQRNYGVAAQEQFTAAVDMIQVMFNCCGVNSAVEYDTSLWRLQALGPSLAVPLTCCRLENYNHPNAYLDPKPLNASLCQALEHDRHLGFRHTEGCGEYLEQWYRHQYVIFLAVGLVVVLIEFAVLLSTILACTKLYRYRHDRRCHRKDEETNSSSTSSSSSTKNHNHHHHHHHHNQQNKIAMKQRGPGVHGGAAVGGEGGGAGTLGLENRAPVTENIYHRRSPFNYNSDEGYTMSNSFRQNYKIFDKT